VRDADYENRVNRYLRDLKEGDLSVEDLEKTSRQLGDPAAEEAIRRFK
jgi:hypothetical protein